VMQGWKRSLHVSVKPACSFGFNSTAIKAATHG